MSVSFYTIPFYATALLLIATCSTPEATTVTEADTPAPLELSLVSNDSSLQYDYHQSDTLIKETDFVLIAHPKQAMDIAPKSIRAHIRNGQKTVQNFIGTDRALPLLNLHYYHRAEDKGMVLKNTNQSQIDFTTNTIHTIINSAYPLGFSAADYRWYCRQWLGQPATEILEGGLAVRFAPKWQLLGYQHWAGKILQAEGSLSLTEFWVYLQSENISPIFQTALAGIFVDFLLEKKGKKDFLANYKFWKPSPAQLSELETEWSIFLTAYLTKKASQPTTSIRTIVEQSPYFCGFNFAHEGYRIHNGYGSRKAKQSLKRMAQINTNAIAIVPYSFMRDPRRPDPIPISNNAGAENDESIICTNYDAHQLGMITLLKPQIWIRSSWPGDIDMKSEADWDTFFHYYSNWILHYALLAEIHQFDLLCIGVELSEATLQHPDRWRKLIRKVRHVYSGPITYDANWGKEYETLAFWSDLDYMGLSCYYPITQNKNPSRQSLQHSFDDIVKKIDKVAKENQRPLLLTEIGFRNVSHPWTLPHAAADGRSVNPVHQERAYRAVFESLKKSTTIAGLFWWKYPTFLTYNSHNPTGFTPLGTPAEATVKQYFGAKK